MSCVSGRHHRWIDVSIGMHIPVDWRLDPWRGDLRRRDACAGTHRAAATNETVTVGCEKLPGRLRRQGEEIGCPIRKKVRVDQCRDVGTLN